MILFSLEISDPTQRSGGSGNYTSMTNQQFVNK